MGDETLRDPDRMMIVQMTVGEAIGLLGELFDADQHGHPFCEECVKVVTRLADKANEPAPEVYTTETPWGTITSTAPIQYMPGSE